MIDAPLNVMGACSHPEQLLGWLSFVGIQLRTDSKEGRLLLSSGHWGQRIEMIVWDLALIGHLGCMKET